MQVTYDSHNGVFALRTGLHEGDLCKKVPGCSWDGQRDAWTCPATWPAYVAINGVFAHNLQAGESYVAWGQWAWTQRYGPLTALRFELDFPLIGPTAERLWPLQRVAVRAMTFAERYGEFDEMGGGKTRTTLATMKLAVAEHGEAEVFPALVVCPNKVRRTWRQQALDAQGTDDTGRAFWPELRIEILPKTKAAQKKLLDRVKTGGDDAPQVVVVNWEALRTLSRLEKFGNVEMTPAEKTPGLLNEIDWRTVVADEAHRAKDRKAKQTRALKAIAFGTPATGARPARWRFALTGTPVSSNSAEAWSILNFLDEVAWPAYSRMVDRYATTIWTVFGNMEIGGIDPQHREEFYQAFLPFNIRRLRQQFDANKPRVLAQTLTVPLEPKQATAYRSLVKDMVAEMGGGTVLSALDKMQRAGRLHQVSQAYGEMVDKGRRHPATGETILDLQLTAPSNKVKVMLELIEELGIEAGREAPEPGGGLPRGVVFGSPSRQLIALCEEALMKKKIPYTLIAGGMSDHDQEISERLFETGAARVALCVISAAKEGINSLVSADTLVFLQRSWDPVENAQFQARVDRPGQRSDSVQIIDVISEGTLEEFDKLEKLAEKGVNFQEVVNDDATLARMLEFTG